jgi:hypothetical protein
LEWSANESGYGQNVLNIAENNFFGIQNAGNGATTMGGLSIVPCQRNGQPIPVNSKNACVAPGTTWGQELVGSLNMSNKGSTYLSAFENALISGYGVAGALQAIGDNGWNGSSTYGATLTTNMKLFDFMNNNGYLQ